MLLDIVVFIHILCILLHCSRQHSELESGEVRFNLFSMVEGNPTSVYRCSFSSFKPAPSDWWKIYCKNSNSTGLLLD